MMMSPIVSLFDLTSKFFLAMLNVQESTKIIISALKKYGIKKIVLSPGGTNIPISHAVQNDSFFECFSMPDERSAMYFAIGLYLETGEIIATSCTSAQATRNYIPGLTEAFYKKVPILAITTSKLGRYQYQEYMQAPDQCSMPKDSVKAVFDIPPVIDNNTRVECINSISSAILELRHNNYGPVQINLRIDDALQNRYEETELPTFNKVDRYMAWDNWPIDNLTDKKILLLIGEHRPFSKSEIQSIENFCSAYNTTIYCNHLSNYFGKYSINGNLLIASGWFYDLQPDILITIGGQTGDYPIFGALSNASSFEHWRVNEDGNYVNTYGKLSKIFQCQEQYFFDRFKSSMQNSPQTYLNEWKSIKEKMNISIDLPFSNLFAAQFLHSKIPINSTINFAILNSLRSWSFYDLPQGVKSFSNVAAFGIDGCTSTLVGESMISDRLYFLVTGDLAFFYDMNVLGIRHLRENIRILLVNNGGGGEFVYMTSTWDFKPQIGKYISANGHFSTAKGWAVDCGFKYLSAQNKEEFISSCDEFLSQSDKPILFEIFTTEQDDTVAVNALINTNTKKATSSIIKKIINKVINK